ncbi:MAG: hypothetical protein ACYC6B_09505 [Thermoleophilia bacterium]
MKLKSTTDLLATIEELSPIQTHLLTQMAEAMVGDIPQTINTNSDILTPKFVDSFSNRLQMHHATHYERFNKKSFEYAFLASAIYAGHHAIIVEDSTNPGADLIIDDVPFSLKTEAAESIQEHRITISKLMEARWIRECLTEEDFARETTCRVVEHIEKYNRIMMLRAFTISPTEVRYDLMEIPKELFLRIGTLGAKDFSARTSNGSSSANIMLAETGNDKKAFSVRLDGSVEKITISGLLVSLCLFHGSWTVQSVPPE